MSAVVQVLPVLGWAPNRARRGGVWTASAFPASHAAMVAPVDPPTSGAVSSLRAIITGPAASLQNTVYSGVAASGGQCATRRYPLWSAMRWRWTGLEYGTGRFSGKR